MGWSCGINAKEVDSRSPEAGVEWHSNEGFRYATPFESASLNLQLFDLRREPVVREARQWFLQDFTPETLEEFVSVATGPRNTAFRMVLGYRDMAASLVTTGAIDAEAFRAAHGEIFRCGGDIEAPAARCACGGAVAAGAGSR